MATTYKKSRTPDRFADDDLENFFTGVLLFGTEHAADPDFYPNYADLTPLIPVFITALQVFNVAKQTSEARFAKYQLEVEPLRQNMIGLRRLMPALFGNDEMLDAFGLYDAIPTDVDQLLPLARQCRDHWISISDPIPPPEYAPLAGKLDGMAGLITALETAQAALGQANIDKNQAQNAKDLARSSALMAERGMFNWYRGFYTDPQNDFWTETPWGKSSGGGSSEPLPAVEGFGYDVPSRTGSFDEVIGRVGYTAQITENVEPYDWTEIYQGQETSFVHDPGVGSWVFRVRAYTDIVGIWSALVEVVIAQ